MTSATIIDAVRLLLFPALMAFAAASDFVSMTISNKVSLALLFGFLVVACASGMSAGDLAMHFAAALTVLAASFGLFVCGTIGGGDAKLAAATALWLGFEALLPYFLLAAMLGGVLTVVIIQFRLMPLPQLLKTQAWAARLHRQDAGVPYGLALAGAALLVYPQSALMAALGT
jgi:prepilin peptidase CpaA